mmetsp:Transcript_8321/g.23845  ORF Transcript_8321/g.23845 Transcript_8321/m.23845 type:complete len:104 (+) Transcript_8321:925-1236(+)
MQPYSQAPYSHASRALCDRPGYGVAAAAAGRRDHWKKTYYYQRVERKQRPLAAARKSPGKDHKLLRSSHPLAPVGQRVAAARERRVSGIVKELEVRTRKLRRP